MQKSLVWMISLAGCAGCTRRSSAVPSLTPGTLLPGQAAIPYPADLYTRRIEGEVLLYLVVDSSGSVIRDSTRVVTSSGQAAFDAAALQAAPTLRFAPARRGARPVAGPIQLPIRFTLPDSVKHAGAHP